MALRIKKPGLLATVQDLGRTGFRRFGINPNGVMDSTAARAINILLDNNEHAAVIEMYFPTGEVEFEKPCCFAIGGAELNAELNGMPISNWSVHSASGGSVLRFRERVVGSRTYLAVRDGFAVDRWLDSSSTNLTARRGGLNGQRLSKDDVIGYKRSTDVPLRRLGPSMIPRYNRFPTVRVIAGPEFEWLTSEAAAHFQKQSYSVSPNSDRMGYRLAGDPLERSTGDEMISSAVAFGTVQLLPDGQLIVLMADHQTTGGYPRIANVIAADLPLLAQIGPGDGVGFHVIAAPAALEVLLDRERDFQLLKVGCMFGYTA